MVKSQLSGFFSSYWSQITDLSIPPPLLFFALLFDGESVLLGITWILGPTTSLGLCCMDYLLLTPASPAEPFPLDPAHHHLALQLSCMRKAYSSPHMPLSLTPSLYFPSHGSSLKALSALQSTLSTSSLLIPLTQSSLLSAFTSSLKLLLPGSQMACMLQSILECVCFIYF